MGSPHEFDFSKILDQTQYTYLSESLTNKDEFERPLGRSRGEKSPWAPPLKDSLVNRLRPMVVMVGALEVVIGLTLALAVILYEHDYNELYDTVDTGRLMSCGGLVVLTISGIMLLTSVFYDKKRLMRYHILLSTILCVYIFALSVVKIHFAIIVLERDIRKLILPESRHFLVSNACVIGISTMSGSVIHFIANVTVFTYYNLKYLRPILFNCGP
ncbi:hypothetical protein SFRURICE_007533 [Spodoptera frugiperda]|uniref:SFRICE_024178 n=1 Tax=Spodoptera frugiperda TaxID=7108 RepID=A0A2H1VWY9_SPOFR|nr:hypothetical protein SFRURICE_007533 [Spodoptera frugiperda]